MNDQMEKLKELLKLHICQDEEGALEDVWHTGHYQGGHQRPFPGTGSSYAVEITKAIPNLHARMNTPNQGIISARETGSNKLKNPFTGPYCAYYRFYGHRTEDYRNIQVLAEQRTHKDHPSFRRNRARNKSPYRFNEMHCGRH
ncbi:hypothetical protein Fot_15014 [Forsythia ovata]|uniref:Uncharacterized protein n=1 Tax=Forsythia ovata TaxID=205694 RepID=A0ABD1W8A4_9LAMI